jgi:hypothetical protein
MVVFLLGLAPAVSQLTISGFEPRPATPWVETTKATCGHDHLEFSRPLYPLGGLSSIRVNGRPIRGNLGQSAQELSEVRAAYRVSVLCSHDKTTMTLRWVRGLADGPGHAAYRAGALTIKGGTLISSTAEDANAEAFWYR